MKLTDELMKADGPLFSVVDDGERTVFYRFHCEHSVWEVATEIGGEIVETSSWQPVSDYLTGKADHIASDEERAAARELEDSLGVSGVAPASTPIIALAPDGSNYVIGGTEESISA